MKQLKFNIGTLKENCLCEPHKNQIYKCIYHNSPVPELQCGFHGDDEDVGQIGYQVDHDGCEGSQCGAVEEHTNQVAKMEEQNDLWKIPTTKWK